MHRDPLGNRPLRKGWLASHQIVERTAEAVDVRAGVDIVAVDRLLGRKKIGGAHDLLVMHQRERFPFFVHQG